MYVPFKSICECVAVDVSCLGAGPGPGKLAAVWEKAEWELWHLSTAGTASQSCPLLRPLISLPSSLISADGLASDFPEKTEDIK